MMTRDREGVARWRCKHDVNEGVKGKMFCRYARDIMWEASVSISHEGGRKLVKARLGELRKG
jgi:hypothetical protein